MKRRGLILLFVVVLLPVGLLCAVKSYAGIDFNITVPLPGLEIEGPPEMAEVPGTYVYFAPDVETGLFFYHGYWYRPYRGEWYLSAEYSGPWGRIAIGNVPPHLLNLPPDYRDVPPGYERMPYHMVERNWRRWEEERYWDGYWRRDGHTMPHRGHGGMGMGMGHM